jgi:short-subunit dehydrogenase
MDLTNTTALVTGASSGIGEEFAVQLAARDVNLVLVARRREKLDSVRASLLARHPSLRIEVITADLSQPGAGAELQRQVTERGLDIDILINNAGAGSHTPFLRQAPEVVAAQIQLNCGSLVDLTARFLPAMTRAGHGLVINVASTAAFQPVPTMAVYGATKAFVLSFTEALWWETRDSGVRVLALCPGATETEFFAAAGQQFATSGRTTPVQVVTAALNAADGTAPTELPGALAKLSALGNRLMPRRLMPRMAQRAVRPTARSAGTP